MSGRLYGPAAPDESSPNPPSDCAGVLSGHEGAVLNVHYNSSGTFALSCGKDRTVRLWSLGKAALLKTYDGHGHEVRDVACSTDNSRLASVGGDRQARARAPPSPSSPAHPSSSPRSTSGTSPPAAPSASSRATRAR